MLGNFLGLLHRRFPDCWCGHADGMGQLISFQSELSSRLFSSRPAVTADWAVDCTVVAHSLALPRRESVHLFLNLKTTSRTPPSPQKYLIISNLPCYPYPPSQGTVIFSGSIPVKCPIDSRLAERCDVSSSWASTLSPSHPDAGASCKFRLPACLALHPRPIA